MNGFNQSRKELAFDTFQISGQIMILHVNQ